MKTIQVVGELEAVAAAEVAPVTNSSPPAEVFISGYECIVIHWN